MIVLLRSTDGQPDSRFEKYVDYLGSNGVDHITICWDRFGTKIESERHIYYKKYSSYGLRFGNVRSLLGFNIFLFKKLISHRKEYKVVHAADFDTILPAMIMKLLFRKKVIYDIYDWYIDSRGLFKSKLRYLIQLLEFFNIKLSDMVIVCEPEREKQIMFRPRKLEVLPNIPSFKERKQATKPCCGGLSIAYVGILGLGRGLHNLIKLAEKNPDVRIDVGGFGPLEDEFRLASDKIHNLHYHGRLTYGKTLDLMGGADLVYAIYERINPNNILAAPNKYYEGLYLGKPIITTVGTLVGNKVSRYDTGYCIDEEYKSLETLIQGLTKDALVEKGKNAAALWNGTYKDYVSRFMNNVYLPFIKSAYE